MLCNIEKYMLNTPIIDNDLSFSDVLFKGKIEDSSGIKIHLLETLANKINTEKIFGQEHAVIKIERLFKRKYAGLRSNNKPIGVLLHAGPTGTGKSQLPQECADHLNIPIFKAELSMFSESTSVTRLGGSNAGYVGYEEGAQFFENLNRNKNHPCVIVFEELEKAHKNIFNFLLPVLDTGTLVNAKHQKVSLTNALIVFTSNIGANDIGIGKTHIGFGEKIIDQTTVDKTIKKAIHDFFPAEFLNRIDNTIIFSPLKHQTVISIVKKEMSELTKKLKTKNIKLTYNENLIEKIAEKSYSMEYGARPVQRYIEELCDSFIDDERFFKGLINGGALKLLDLHDDNDNKIFIYIFNEVKNNPFTKEEKIIEKKQVTNNISIKKYINYLKKLDDIDIDIYAERLGEEYGFYILNKNLKSLKSNKLMKPIPEEKIMLIKTFLTEFHLRRIKI